MAVDNNLKEKYMEYQFLMQQLQQLQQNNSSLEKHISDLNSLKNNLENISKTKVNTESLMPLGSGIFLKSELKDNKTVIMNVGSNVCVEKNIDEAMIIVDKQLGEVVNVMETLQSEIMTTTSMLQEMQENFKKLRVDQLGE